MTTACENAAEFTEETEAQADSKGRLALSGVGAAPGRRYIVRRLADDTLMLIPARMIPEREMVVWENPELRESLLRGIEQSERGDTKHLGSFAGHADERDEE